MVKVRRIRLAYHRGRDATVLLLPVGESVKYKHQGTNGISVHSVRRVRATSSTCTDALFTKYSDPDELSRALIAGDPDIDLEMTGRVTGPCDRVHIDGDGQFVFAPGASEDRVMEVALEAGAEDVITDEDGAIEVLTAPADFEAVKNALQSAGLHPEVAEVTVRAENTVALAGEDAQKMQKLLDMLEDQDDVQNVYHNAELDLE